jgi:long-chain fatty acid transport protein
MKSIKSISIATLALALNASTAYALNGFQLGGSGIQNAAMGGASIALPLDSIAPANNPAGIAFVPAGFSLNMQAFNGQSVFTPVPAASFNNDTHIQIPEIGAHIHYSDQISLGVAIAGQGAGATYQPGPAALLGSPVTKNSLTFMEVIPTVAWKVRPDLSLGLALNLARSTFEASGISPDNVHVLPSHGSQSATGVGARLGLLWHVNPEFSVGLNYKTKTSMSSFSGYKDDMMAAHDGKVDIPGQYGIGLAWSPAARLTLAADWLQVNYAATAVMQASPGFNWKDQQIVRLGASYQLDDKLTIRVGYSQNSQQIDSNNIQPNFIAPAINNKAYTAGLSWKLSEHSKLNFGYENNPSVQLQDATGAKLSSKVEIIMIGYQHSF